MGESTSTRIAIVKSSFLRKQSSKALCVASRNLRESPRDSLPQDLRLAVVEWIRPLHTVSLAKAPKEVHSE